MVRYHKNFAQERDCANCSRFVCVMLIMHAVCLVVVGVVYLNT